ncbi:MAG: YbjN domain-containing protein [Alphaproteobacteria bacterium]|nr:YbjN domain-containing protein [Myxococcales bacterium]MCB9687330.1 YbjN domain-containing protein [Alphaproteobacteria bacterium]MCB9697888.1 YbjN domain-containing protein [Alphaproteobacteria bacterium]
MSRLPKLEELVTQYLGQMNLSPEHSEDGLYLFKYGSTVVMISLFEEADDTYVRFASVMLKDFEPSLELLQRILRLNTEVLFGSFLLFEDDTLSFSATLLGNQLDYEEFDKTLRYVAKISDDYDDELQALGGGQRAVDVLQES